MAFPDAFSSADTQYNLGAGGNFGLPASAFTSYNLEKTATGASGADQGISNIERQQMIDTIYSFAQSKTSLLVPMIEEKVDFNATFMEFTREGNTSWVAKTKSAPKTPKTNLEHDRLAIFGYLLHNGLEIDLDNERRSRINLSARFQMKMTWDLGRIMDKFVQYSVTNPVIKLITQVDKDFSGAQTTGVEYPRAENFLLKTSGATINANLSTVTTLDDATASQPYGAEDFFDYLGQKVEDANTSVSDYIIIGSPKLRRAIKRLDKFRNRDYTIVYAGGDENSDVFRWNGWTFCIVKPDSYYNLLSRFSGSPIASRIGSTNPAYADKQLKFNKNGDYDSGGTALGVDLDGSTAAKGKGLETFIVLHRDALCYGEDTGANFMGVAQEHEYSFARLVYLKTGLAIGRRDPRKVWVVLYKTH